MSASVMKLLQTYLLGFRHTCAGLVPHNQTCVMVNTSADPVAMMLLGAGQEKIEQTSTLVGCNLNRHAD